MRRRELLDETFDIYHAGGYALTIAPCREGVRLTLVETARSQFIGLVDYPLAGGVTLDPAKACEQLVGDFPWLKGGFGKVVYLTRGSAFAPVPVAYSDREHAKQLLQTTVELSDLDEVHTMRLDDRAQLLFSVPNVELYPWRCFHPKLTVVHHDGALFEWASHLGAPGYLLLVHANDGFVTLTLMEGSKLMAMRAVNAQRAEDVLYHVLTQLQALDVALPKVSYLVLGEGILGASSEAKPGARAEGGGLVSPESIGALLGHYLSRNTLATGKRFRYAFSYLLQRMEQQYFPLFAAVQCV